MDKRILLFGIASAIAVMVCAEHVGAAGTRVLMFNQSPASAHSVRINGGPAEPLNSSAQGALVNSIDVTPGDAVVFSLVGTPVAVTSFGAVEDDGAVIVYWTIWADERNQAIEVYRSQGEGSAREHVATLDPWTERFVDLAVEPGKEYTYQLAVVGTNGERSVSLPVRVQTRALAVALEQNVPNPFNPATSISWVAPERVYARLDIFDVRGARVATLHDGEVPAGRWSVWWDGRDRHGQPVASGTYFYRLRTGRGALTRKMVLVK